MSTHFCRVGKIKPNLDKLINLKELDKRIANLVEETTKVDYSQDLGASF